MTIEHEVIIKSDILFAEHDGVKLLGDLYRPKGMDNVPVLVAAHGAAGSLGTANSTGIGAITSPSTVTRFSRSSTD